MRSRLGILAITGAENPEALAGVVLDPKIIPHRDQLRVTKPPFAEDTLRSVGAADTPRVVARPSADP